MSIKLLPGAVNPADPSQAFDVSSSLVPVTQRGITSRASQSRLVPSGDTFSRSASGRPGEANWIDATVVEDSQSDARASDGDYVSGLIWGRPVASTAIALYLFYVAAPAGWSGRLIDLYA